MSTDNSDDIFFKIKKQILDKLDIILQKVNLEIIGAHCSCEKSNDFTFIELAQFETEISSLFIYFDKLYQSLNSTISDYNSPAIDITQLNNLKETNMILQKQNLSLKENVEFLQKNNNMLIIENENLYKQICDVKLSQEKQSGSLYQESLKETQNIKTQTNQRMLENIKQLSFLIGELREEYEKDLKLIKAKLIKMKFSILEDRVQIIGKIKQYTSNHQQNADSNSMRKSSIFSINENKTECVTGHCEGSDNADHLLEELDSILDLCRR